MHLFSDVRGFLNCLCSSQTDVLFHYQVVDSFVLRNSFNASEAEKFELTQEEYAKKSGKDHS